MRVGAAPSRFAGARVLGLFVGWATTAAAEADIKPWKGGATPPLKLRNLQDKPFDLASLGGRGVVINFWATWCEPCRDEMPALERLPGKLKGRSFEIVTGN